MKTKEEKKFDCVVFDTEDNHSYCQTIFGSSLMNAIDNEVALDYINEIVSAKHTHDNVIELGYRDGSVSYKVFTPVSITGSWGENNKVKWHIGDATHAVQEVIDNIRQVSCFEGTYDECMTFILENNQNKNLGKPIPLGHVVVDYL